MTSTEQGRTAHVVVTGAGRGIGRALAEGLAADGAAVTCLDLDLTSASETAELVRQAGGTALGARCDVSVLEEVETSLEAAVARFGPVTALVANAGGAAGERTPFLELTEASWRRMLNRNLHGAFCCGHVYGRHMSGHAGGAIVYITSVSARRVQAGLAHYAAAKAGLEQLMQAMALELAEHGIRVNAVAPGMTLTPGNEAIMTAPGVMAEQESRVPLGRIGRPTDLVGAVAYLLSDRATYVTGTTIVVDGGLTLV